MTDPTPAPGTPAPAPAPDETATPAADAPAVESTVTVDEAPQPVKPPLTQRPWFKPGLIGAAGGIILGVLLTLAIPAAINTLGSLGGSSQFDSAMSSCDLKAGDGASVSDGGNTLTLNGEGEDDTSGLAVEDLICVLDELGMPDAVFTEMSQTTAMDGRQEADWDNYEASYKYHPDNGLDIVVTTK